MILTVDLFSMIVILIFVFAIVSFTSVYYMNKLMDDEREFMNEQLDKLKQQLKKEKEEDKHEKD